MLRSHSFLINHMKALTILMNFFAKICRPGPLRLTQKNNEWIIDYISGFTHPRPTFNGGLVKTPLKLVHWPLARYVKLRVAHAPGMPGTFSPPLRISDSDMHYGTCVTHVSWCMTGSLTSVSFFSRWRGKRSRHSRRMRNPQFYVSGKRPMGEWLHPIQNNECNHLSMP